MRQGILALITYGNDVCILRSRLCLKIYLLCKVLATSNGLLFQPAVSPLKGIACFWNLEAYTPRDSILKRMKYVPLTLKKWWKINRPRFRFSLVVTLLLFLKAWSAWYPFWMHCQLFAGSPCMVHYLSDGLMQRWEVSLIIQKAFHDQGREYYRNNGLCKNETDERAGPSRLLRNVPDKEGKENLHGLTHRELTVLLNFYRGISIKEQSKRLGLSDKTIYTHRKVGLGKLYIIRVWFSDSRVFRDEVCAVKIKQKCFRKRK